MPARRAREAGWRYREIAAGHFHMLVDPAAVADALLDLIGDSHECTAAPQPSS